MILTLKGHPSNADGSYLSTLGRWPKGEKREVSAEVGESLQAEFPDVFEPVTSAPSAPPEDKAVKARPKGKARKK